MLACHLSKLNLTISEYSDFDVPATVQTRPNIDFADEFSGKIENVAITRPPWRDNSWTPRSRFRSAQSPSEPPRHTTPTSREPAPTHFVNDFQQQELRHYLAPECKLNFQQEELIHYLAPIRAY